MTDKVRYWLELAEYDLETARAMLETGRYLYVGFMCHQVIEKALKAVIAGTGISPPKIHNLGKLAERAGIASRMTEPQTNILDTLDPLNIQARYPDERHRLSRELSADRCRCILAETEELYECIKAML